MVISTWRSACLVFSYRSAASINTISSLILRLFYVRFLAPIHLTSCQAQQISNFHTFPNLPALIFQRHFFYTLSDILAYIQDFPVGQDCV